METIYGIQADTETLREAHERNKRMQQKPHEQTSVADKFQDISLGKTKSPPRPMLSAKSSSTSALPSTSNTEAVHISKVGTKANSQLQSSGSTATSPFFGAADHHPTAAEQLRSATHSPAFLSKFYDGEHRIPSTSAIPWLALPGAVTPTIGGTESSSLFGRRRSDGGLSNSGTSTPLTSDKHALESSQQENPHPHPPQPQPHYHHHHLLSHQELSELSRTNSPLPSKEAIPSYLKKGAADSLHSMERSLSNPGSNIVHTAPSTPFLLPFHHSTLSATPLPTTSAPQASISSGHVASPSHLLFPFSGPTQPSRQEMERASSTGVLPINRQYQNQSRHQQYRGPSQLGGNQGNPPSIGHLPSVIGNTCTGAGSSTSTFFRTATPLGASPNMIGYGPHSTTFGPTPTKLNPFGHPSDSNLPSNKEVHA